MFYPQPGTNTSVLVRGAVEESSRPLGGATHHWIPERSHALAFSLSRTHTHPQAGRLDEAWLQKTRVLLKEPLFAYKPSDNGDISGQLRSAGTFTLHRLRWGSLGKDGGK